jgi:hypothetical protein
MSKGRRTPGEDDGRRQGRKDEPETVPVDVESQERQLEEAGWEPVDRMGKRVWRHPQSGHLYPHGSAVKRLRLDRAGS